MKRRKAEAVLQNFVHCLTARAVPENDRLLGPTDEPRLRLIHIPVDSSVDIEHASVQIDERQIVVKAESNEFVQAQKIVASGVVKAVWLGSQSGEDRPDGLRKADPNQLFVIGDHSDERLSFSHVDASNIDHHVFDAFGLKAHDEAGGLSDS